MAASLADSKVLWFRKVKAMWTWEGLLLLDLQKNTRLLVPHPQEAQRCPKRDGPFLAQATPRPAWHAERCAPSNRASPAPGSASQPFLCLPLPLCLFGLRTHTNTLQGLRLHDNPALVEACTGSTHVYPIFIIDPFFLQSGYK